MSESPQEWAEENREQWTERLRSLMELYEDSDTPAEERKPIKALIDRARQYVTPNQFSTAMSQPPVRRTGRELQLRQPGGGIDINQAIEQVRQSATVHNEVANRTVQELSSIRRSLEERAARDFAVRNLRALAASSSTGLDKKTRSVLRRAYHAIRVLHNYRACKLKGCDLCQLGNDIMYLVGSNELLSQSTYTRDPEIP
jgi:uncharacterized protein (UPF0147 family)